MSVDLEKQKETLKEEIKEVHLKELKSLNSIKIIKEEYEVDEYLTQTEIELKKIGHSLSQRMFSDAIINVLDNLMQGNSFNRLIFVYILEESKLRKDSPIKLQEFFEAYFKIYEAMKKNRIDLSNSFKKIKERIEDYKNRLTKNKKNEKILEGGVTSNSKVKFLINSINFFSKQSINTSGYIIKIALDDVNYKDIQLNITNLRTKQILGVKSMDSILSIKVLRSQQLNSEIVYSESLNLKEILEVKLVRKIVIPDYGELEFEVIWINSKINYYMKLINHYERQFVTEEHSLDTLDRSLKFIQEPFKIMLSPSQDAIQNFRSEIEVSEKIETFILKIIGKNIILWEKVFFFVNKIMLFALFPVFFYRCDYITMMICIIISAFEIAILSRKNYNKLLILIAVSWLLDSIWFIFYLNKWHIANIQDEVESISIYRQLSIFVSGAIILMKLIQLFSLWRLAITEKVKKINPMKRRKSRNSFYENFLNSPVPRESNNTNKKSFNFPIKNQV